jgi:hypothetical protein
VIPPDRDWHGRQGASPEALARLRHTAPVELPDAYYGLLAFSDGGEGPLPMQPLYFQLDPAHTALKTFERGLNDDFFPGFVIIGSNGGGEYIAFDTRGCPPWPIVSMDMTNINLDESVRLITPNFQEFLEHVGIEATD